MARIKLTLVQSLRTAPIDQKIYLCPILTSVMRQNFEGS